MLAVTHNQKIKIRYIMAHTSIKKKTGEKKLRNAPVSILKSDPFLSPSRVIDILAELPGLLGVNECREPLIAPSSSHGDPDVLLRSEGANGFTEASPAKTRFSGERTVAETSVRDPFLDNIFDEADLSTEVVGCRDALEFGVDLWASPGAGRSARSSSRWFGLEVQ